MENKIIKAIQKINPTAEVSVSAEDINSIVWENGTTPISVSDIQAKILELPTDKEEATARETKKASGKQKLLDLGLSEEEVKALIGV